MGASLLINVLDRIRGKVDLPSSKYTDVYLMSHVVMPEMLNVYSRLMLNAENPVYHRYNIDIVTDQEHYQLPPCVGEIHRVAELDSSGRVIREWTPRGEMHPRGPNWKIEGNCLSFRPFPSGSESNTWDVWYMSNGDYKPHYDTAGTAAADGTTFTFASSVDYGELDYRENAYAGSIVRAISSTGGSTIEERVVESYAPATRVATMRRPFSVHNGQSDVTYEVVPFATQALTECVAWACCISLGAQIKVSTTQYRMFVEQYRRALKTAGDHLANLNMRKPKHFDKNVLDNRDRASWFLGG